MLEMKDMKNALTVGNIIEKLARLDPNLPVVYWDPYFDERMWVTKFEGEAFEVDLLINSDETTTIKVVSI